MVRLRKILITTDLSEFSLAAMEYATSLGFLYSSTLYLLHVLEHPPAMFHSRERDAESQAHRVVAEKEAMAELKNFIARRTSREVNLVPVIRTGAPDQVIKEFAEEEAVDLIVMATHGRTGLRHILLGSVAERVVRNSSVPVFIVKPRPLRDNILDDEDIENELHLR